MSTICCTENLFNQKKNVIYYCPFRHQWSRKIFNDSRFFAFLILPPLHVGETSNISAWFRLFAFHCGLLANATGAEFFRAEMAGHYTLLSGQEHVCIVECWRRRNNTICRPSTSESLVSGASLAPMSTSGQGLSLLIVLVIVIIMDPTKLSGVTGCAWEHFVTALWGEQPASALSQASALALVQCPCLFSKPAYDFFFLLL